MHILTGYKKKGAEGFMEFVETLEGRDKEEYDLFVQDALLEDPVYMKWVIPNIITYEYIVHLNLEEMASLSKTLRNPIKTLLLSFHGTKKENEFMEKKLTTELRKDYLNEALSINKIEPAQQVSARSRIVKAIRKLQKTREISPFPWILPFNDILNGSNYEIKKDGSFILYFENEIIALQGNIKNQLRNGLWEHFYPDGTLMAEGEYKKGMKDGYWKFFYQEGHLKLEGLYVDDKRHDDWIKYDKQGNNSIISYESGRQKAS